MNTLLSICWSAIGTMLAITVGVCFFVLMFKWAEEIKWCWKKIVGVSFITLFVIFILIVCYIQLSYIFCK